MVGRPVRNDRIAVGYFTIVFVGGADRQEDALESYPRSKVYMSPAV